MSMTVAEAAEYYIQELISREGVGRSTYGLFAYIANNFMGQISAVKMDCTQVDFKDGSVLNIPQVINK